MKRKLSLNDAAIITGCVLVCVSIWLFSPRVAIGVSGLLLIGGAVLLYKPAK